MEVDGRIIIYFTDGRNPPRFLDITGVEGILVPPAPAPENLAGLAEHKETRGAAFSWDEVERASGFNLYIDGVRFNEGPIADNFFNIGEFPFPPAIYEVYVTSRSGQFESDPSNIIELDMRYLAPANFQIDDDEFIQPSAPLATWDEQDDFITEGYNLYLNDEKVNDEPLTDTQFQFENLEGGAYTVYVTAVGGGFETEPSDEKSFTITGLIVGDSAIYDVDVGIILIPPFPSEEEAVYDVEVLTDVAMS